MATNIQIVGQILDTDIVNRYTPEDERLLIPTLIQETFGQSDDYIEYFIFDIGGNILNSDYNYRSYKLPSTSAYSQSLLPNLQIDPIQDIQNLGYESGEVTARYNFFRKIASEPFSNELFIQQISSDRTEIRVNSTILSSTDLLTIVSNFADKQSEVPYYYYVILNFGSNNQIIAVNTLSSISDTGEVSILFKLYQPLPLNINLKDTFWIVEEVTNSYIFDINLDKLITPLPLPKLKGPNFDIDLELKDIVPTPYNNYNQLVSLLTGSYYQAVLNTLSNQQTNININYSIFNNFIHYSSAENRLSNFVYKIGEIENFQSEININTPLTSSNALLINSVNKASSSINDIIATFDGFESYLYFTSSSLTSSIKEYTLETGSYFQYNVAPYPKSNSTQPYSLYPSSSVTTQNWFATASNIAVAYDIDNKDILIDTIPSYIKEDPDNYLPYIIFVNMIGQQFDNIWIYIDKLTDIWDNDNNLEKGISQDLVYDWLQSFGIKLYSSQENQTILDYNFGGYSGSVDFNNDYSPSSSFLNNTPRKNLAIDNYKRLYHNLPYLFKTKGSYGGLQGLITIFGITGSILPIKEYGGTTDYQDLKGYSNSKIDIESNHITGSVLSSIKRLETSTTSSRAVKSQDLHFIDVSFSPQTQIDAAVSSSITSVDPTWVLDNYIGDPLYMSLDTYPSLSYERDYWFTQTFDQSFDYGGYIRLIQFFDNSLFKMIKDFTPARSNTWTGVSIKSPVLERPKVPQFNPLFNNDNNFEADYSGAVITPVYDPYYAYLAGDKEPYYEGNISGSYIDTYAIFEENNRNPYLVNNTIGYVPPGFISGNTNFILNTDAPRYENFFLNSDFNVLQNNVDDSLESIYRKKLTPISSIDTLGRVFTSYSITEPIQLQDSYLSLESYVKPRYSGVQLYSKLFNTWSIGDRSYGQSPVINYNVNKLGLFTEVTDNVYLSNKSNVNLKYLVDNEGRLTELNERNRNWEEVQNTFKTGDSLNISLFNPQQYSNQIFTNGNKLIHESGYSYYPVFYAYGDESDAPTTTAVFSSPLGQDQNILDRFFTSYTDGGTIVAGGINPSTQFVSSSKHGSGTQFEVWNLFNINNSLSTPGLYFKPGVGPNFDPVINQVTSSYYIIPEQGNYQFSYDFNVFITSNVPPGPPKKAQASMEVWLSGSDGFNLLDANPITGSFSAQTWRGVLGGYGAGYRSVFARVSGEPNVTILAGENLAKYENSFSSVPISFENNIPVDTNYIKYTFFGRQIIDVRDSPETPVNTDGVDLFENIGTFWVKEGNNPTSTTTELFSDLFPPSITSTQQNLLFRKTVNILNTDAVVGEKVVFRFFIDNNNNDLTMNATIRPNGTQPALKVVPSYGDIVANNTEICVDQQANAFYLNTSLSPFFGPASFFNPLESSVITEYSELYSIYGDVIYPFILTTNDKIVVQAFDETGPLLEYTVDKVQFNGSPLLAYIYIKEDIDGYFSECNKFYKILFLKRVIDETNIIINLNKQEGKTSYGFSIPQLINPSLIANIDVINKNVNQQLIDVGTNATI